MAVAAHSGRWEFVRRIEAARAKGRSLTLDPPISQAQLAALESRCRGSVPPEIRDLLDYAAGFSVDDFSVHFSGDQPFEFESIVPRGIPIASDGLGNFWVVDVRSDGGWGPVLFISHDPPVVVVQALDLAAMTDQVLTQDDIAELVAPHVDEVWQKNPRAMPRAVALASDDGVLRAFAEQMEEGFVISDLRSAEVGAGFVWATAGPDTQVRRAGDALVFATQLEKANLFSRLLSRMGLS